MSFDPIAAFDAGAIDSSTADTSILPETPQRIVSFPLGFKSAVIGEASEKPLHVRRNGESDPLRVWKIEPFKDGYSLERIGPSAPLYANTTQSNSVILGPKQQKFKITSSFGIHSIQDPDTELMWEVDHKNEIVMRPNRSTHSQIWAFRDV